MCGPSDDQSKIQAQQMDFYRKLAEQDSAVFGEDQSILKQIQGAYQPILEAGPSQRGFSDAERTNRTTDAIEQNATNFQNAKRAIVETTNGMGGGDAYIPSGVSTVRQGELSGEAAADLSGAQRKIEDEDWATGRDNFDRATAALSSARATLSPTSYAGAATAAGSEAARTAAQIAQQSMSWMQPLAGAAAGVGGGFLAGRGRS